MQLDYKYDESSIGDRTIPDNATTKTLEELGDTVNFIDIWLKLLHANFNARRDAYINAMKVMFKKIPQTIKIALTTKQKVQTLMTDIGGGCYTEKSARGLPPLRRTKLSKKAQERHAEIQIFNEDNKWCNDCKSQLHWHKLEWVDPKYNLKRIKPFSVSSNIFTLVKVIEQLILLVNLY